MAAKKVILQEESKKFHGHSINSYHSGMFTSSNDSKKFCRKTGNIQLDNDDDDEDEEEDNTSKKTENVVVMKFNDIPAAPEGYTDDNAINHHSKTRKLRK